jgi:hypothetical protein
MKNFDFFWVNMELIKLPTVNQTRGHCPLGDDFSAIQAIARQSISGLSAD